MFSQNLKKNSWEDTNSMAMDLKFKNMLFFLENDRYKKLVTAFFHKEFNQINFYSM